MTEDIFRKIGYFKKRNIDLSAFGVSKEAEATIVGAGDDENLVLRLRINSPVFIEAAEKLTSEGIKRISNNE